MEQKNRLLRPLNTMEEAFTLSNEAAPLCVVCVLHLATGPTVAALEAALAQLQSRHCLLQAGIVNRDGRLYFQMLDPVPPITRVIVGRTKAETWRNTAEEALNSYFDKSGPLMKCWYLPAPETGPCELIVCFHHALIDGVSARLLLHELLTLAGGGTLPPLNPVPEHFRFPQAFRGWSLARRLAGFAVRQLGVEWQYRRSGAVAPIPAHSRNAILSFRLTPELSRKLSVRAGRESLSLNSVLLAAVTDAALRHKYTGQGKQLARAISFADLRAGLQPPVSDKELGCYVSMVRLEVPVSGDQGLGQLAARIQKALFRAGRQGEVFLMSMLSKYLVQLTLRMKNQRLGLSALSFIGTLELDKQYGSVNLEHVMAFITNNRFGPEFSAFGKILFGSIGLDFTYLTAETSAEQAQQLLAAVKINLEEFANSPYI